MADFVVLVIVVFVVVPSVMIGALVFSTWRRRRIRHRKRRESRMNRQYSFQRVRIVDQAPTATIVAARMTTFISSLVLRRRNAVRWRLSSFAMAKALAISDEPFKSGIYRMRCAIPGLSTAR